MATDDIDRSAIDRHLRAAARGASVTWSCDTAIAWTLLSGPCRAAFVEAYDADAATWTRGRTLWKALVTMAPHADGDPAAAPARAVPHAVLADHGRLG